MTEKLCPVMQHPIEPVVPANLSSGQNEERRGTEYQGDHPISLIKTEGKAQKVVSMLARCSTSLECHLQVLHLQLCFYHSEKGGSFMKHFRVLSLASHPLLQTLPAVGELPRGSAATALPFSASVHCKQQCSHLLECYHVSKGQ